eukprot:5133593-Lingulodinium_polyedra.AAC.1
MILLQCTVNPSVLPIVASARPLDENRRPNAPTMLQHGFEVFPHYFMDSQMFLLKQVIMRAASIGVHGAISMLKL